MRLRAAPGGDSVGAAIGEGSRSRRTARTSTRTLNILVAARDAGVKRLVFAGSSSAYGDTPTLPKHEDMPTQSAVAVRAAESWWQSSTCQMFTRLYGLETVTIRYFNVFGPRQDPGSPYSGVISLFSTALLEGRQPTIYGDGEQTRDFTYVANVVDGVLRACDAPKAPGEVINVACGRPHLAQRAAAQAMNSDRRHDLAADLRGRPRRRRARFAGRHLEGESAPRLRAARVPRGRIAPHARVVPQRKRRRRRPTTVSTG